MNDWMVSSQAAQVGESRHVATGITRTSHRATPLEGDVDLNAAAVEHRLAQYDLWATIFLVVPVVVYGLFGFLLHRRTHRLVAAENIIEKVNSSEATK